MRESHHVMEDVTNGPRNGHVTEVVSLMEGE